MDANAAVPLVRSFERHLRAANRAPAFGMSFQEGGSRSVWAGCVPRPEARLDPDRSQDFCLVCRFYKLFGYGAERDRLTSITQLALPSDFVSDAP